MSLSKVSKPGSNDKSTFTEIETISFSHEWIIKNFSLCNRRMESTNFKSDDNDDRDWNLVLYPNGNTKRDNKCKGYLSIFLGVTSKKPPEEQDTDEFESDSDTECVSMSTVKPIAKVVYTISVRNSDPKKTRSLSITKLHKMTAAQGWCQFMNRELLFKDIDGFLKDDTLIIQCDIKLQGSISTTSCSNINFPKTSVSCLSEDLKTLLIGSNFSDVTLSVSGQKVAANKCILAARSPVFRAMFENDCVEAKSGSVNIEDIDVDIVEQMLQYIYTDVVPDLSVDNAAGLFAAADKYCLIRLKESCGMYLASSLTVDNCISVLMLADLHSAEHLKSLTLEFIKGKSSVIDSEEWKNMIDQKPQLATDLCRAFYAKK